MGSEYYWGYNIFQDVLINALLNEIDVSDVNFKPKLNGVFTQVIVNYLQNKSDIVYLNFDIEVLGCKYELVANNFITALWLSGVFPDNVIDTMHKSEFNCGDGYLVYNKKQKS
jgi:hypothetical protein